jgi:hypothetical protein
MSEGAALRTEAPRVDGLLAALRRLDRRLEQAVAAMETASPGAAGDLYRGLYISLSEVEELLARPPGAPTLQPNGSSSVEPWPEVLTTSPRLARSRRSSAWVHSTWISS